MSSVDCVCASILDRVAWLRACQFTSHGAIMAQSLTDASRTLCSLLPPRLAARLIAHAAAVGDDPADVVADAVLFHLEEREEADEADQLIALLDAPMPIFRAKEPAKP
jgi:hypothetical protein